MMDEANKKLQGLRSTIKADKAKIKAAYAKYKAFRTTTKNKINKNRLAAVKASIGESKAGKILSLIGHTV